MTNDEVRENMLINLRDWMLAMEAKAELDGDPVSIEGFTDDEGVPVGGLIMVRTPEALKAIMEFAAREGFITPGKGIEDGTATSPEDVVPCPFCSIPIFSVRAAVAETDLPSDTGSANAIRMLWARLTCPGPERPKYRRTKDGRLECAEHGPSFTVGCWPCLETVVAVEPGDIG